MILDLVLRQGFYNENSTNVFLYNTYNISSLFTLFVFILTNIHLEVPPWTLHIVLVRGCSCN